jgi:hypothetical protein
MPAYPARYASKACARKTAALIQIKHATTNVIKTFPVLGTTPDSLFLFQNHFFRQRNGFIAPARGASSGALCHTGPLSAYLGNSRANAW